jgi:hypothetical protein
MNRLLARLPHVLGLWFALFWIMAGPARAQPELSATDAQRDLRILQRALTELHPGLYRHATPAQIDAEFAAAQAAVAPGASRAQMVLLASRLAAAVRCGHTWVNRHNQGPAVQALWARATLPLVLRWVEGRLLVVASATPQVSAGSEIVAIDGHTPAQIAAALLPYLRADGDRDATRRAQLDDDDTGGAMQRLFPLRFPPGPAGWTLRLADGREATVAPLTAAAREAALQAAGWRAPPADWTLRIDGDVAVMTLPTFAFWNGGFDGRAWLARAFADLAGRGVQRLVIDLRRNEGGDDALGEALLSHLIATPFTRPGGRRESAYERVPYILARYLDTWDFGFFDRTGQVTRGEGRAWRLPDSPARTVAPAAPRFGGRVVALVGPRNSSAGFLVARDLQRAGVATLIGQPTGGSLRGLNGGQLAWVTLPASGVAVDIPLVAHYAPGTPPEAGVVPDVPVAPRFDDARAGRDTELDAALAWLAR